MKKYIIGILINVTVTFIPGSIALAHGTNELGPHKGLIQMPGPYHVEVLQDNDGSFRVYLLDIDFKNPTIKNSEVSAALKSQSGNSIDLKCTAMKDYFHCLSTSKDSEKKFKSREFIVKSARDGVQGNESIYHLPLKLGK